MKGGQGQGGAKKPSVKFPGLIKKLEQAAAKKAPKNEPGSSAFPYGMGPGKKR
ncbi:MAG TPA: hypothetical protein VK137_20165 [Planctomycetaceae bacterium]|nr:hypothetical protein [Planctomycetaceae bacterium]